MPDLANDPERFTLRQADAARKGYAQLTEKLGLVTEQLTRLSTRKDLALTSFLISFIAANARHHLVRGPLASLPVSEPRAIGHVWIGAENLRP
jgi:hypothetical protein